MNFEPQHKTNWCIKELPEKVLLSTRKITWDLVTKTGQLHIFEYVGGETSKWLENVASEGLDQMTIVLFGPDGRSHHEIVLTEVLFDHVVGTLDHDDAGAMSYQIDFSFRHDPRSNS